MQTDVSSPNVPESRSETILIVDDMPENLGVLGELLREAGYAVRAANSGAAALRYAAQEPVPALILLDIMMPGMDGYDVLRRLRKDEATRDIAVIFLTAMDDVGDVVRGLRMGAADYIAKPIQPEIVLARVRTQVDAGGARTWLRDQNAFLEAEVARRMADNRRYQEQLERKSNYDDLTGLPNRNLFKDRLGQAVERGRKSGRPLALLTVNLDRFKSINESLGYAAADMVLREAGARFSRCAEGVETIARIEGDEFAVIVEAGGDEASARFARPLLAALARPFDIAGREFYLTASVGIALFPKDGGDGDELLRNADAALAKAKAAGGGCLRFYAANLNARAVERFDIENGLRRAIDRGEFVVHYQPQVSLRTGEIIGAEALVRWQHPQRGLLMPADFIELAEDSGLIVPIGEWVMRRACMQNKAWQEEGLPPLTVAVNMSARQFAAQDIVKLAGTILAETGLDPGCLELELTESAVMADAEAFIQATERLRGLAITLSIDDFGTGFSSLSYLKRFAIDRLKIDKSFVHDITTHPNSAAIALAIISLAHNLKLLAIAEGVETLAQLGFLRSRGCDEMQGYYFSVPVPAEDFTRMLREGRRLEFPGAELPKRTLLLVDDEPEMLAALKRLFRREGYSILAAESGQQGLELMAENDVNVVISDARMPGMDGAEFLGKASRLYPDALRLMLSGYTDLDAVTRAVNSGELFRFLSKPWDDAELLATVREAFHAYEQRHPGNAGGS